ncbi:olfactory receptor 1019-like, partial [Pelobates cultripes]
MTSSRSAGVITVSRDHPSGGIMGSGCYGASLHSNNLPMMPPDGWSRDTVMTPALRDDVILTHALTSAEPAGDPVLELRTVAFTSTASHHHLPFKSTLCIVSGFSDSPQLQFPLFITFLSVYLIIIFSNLIVVLSIILYSHLHTPMYILLCNLSVIDISYTSTILPKLLAMLLTQCKTISFLECFIQLYFFLSFICAEIFLLAAMAYDRYIAICHPLHYSILMSPKHCARLVLTVWVMGLFDPVVHIFLFANLSYCHSHHIDHFFCDVTPLIKLTCSDTFTIEIWNYVDGALSVSAFILTLISYVFIISTILNIQSASGRHKAFSTCSSHITCVIIFYGTLICLYMRPTSMYSPGQDKFFSILYIILIPILNPLLYTLKNKDFKDDMPGTRRWYPAICHPLHYLILMSPKHCARLVLAVWVLGLLEPVAHTILIANFSYCRSHHIDHFFCDVTPLLKLTCSDTFTVELWTYIDGTLVTVSAFILTLISYVFIIANILKIQSANGRHKAFSTCSSHITCVIIFYGTIICLYMRPASTYSPEQDKFFALIYIILIPMLNPLLYTLKNKDFKHEVEFPYPTCRFGLDQCSGIITFIL